MATCIRSTRRLGVFWRKYPVYTRRLIPSLTTKISCRKFSITPEELERYKKELHDTRDRDQFFERLIPDRLEMIGGMIWHAIQFAKRPDETYRLYAGEWYGLEKGTDTEINHQIKTLLSYPGMKEMYETRHFADAKKVDLNKMKEMKDGTLGREYVRFLEKYKLKHYYMKQFGTMKDNPLNYFIMRYFEIHDFTHVLLGYNPSAHEEVAINAFCVAQGFILPARYFLVLGQGFKLLTQYYNEMEHYFDLISEAYQRGKQAEILLGIKIEDYLEHDLEYLRKKWNIQARKTKYTLTKDFQSEIDKFKHAKENELFTICVGPEPKIGI